MDFILKTIERKISFLEKTSNWQDLLLILGRKIEHTLTLILAYNWNRNIESLEPDGREFVIRRIQRPSLASIVEIAKVLDVDQEIFSNKNFLGTLERHARLLESEVETAGVVKEKASEIANHLKRFLKEVEQSAVPFLQKKHDLIRVTGQTARFYTGINLKADGVNYEPWSCPIAAGNFRVGDTYLLYKHNQYFRISPFVHIEDEGNFYLFRSIADRLTGRVRYVHIGYGTHSDFEWPELCNLWIEADPYRRKSPNNTVVNSFENNFKKYIDIGIKQVIRNFLLDNKSSVAATMWGHGGVGKTASIQSLVDDLLKSERKHFDYILFLSAKDRFFNYQTGAIEQIENTIGTFDAIIKKITFLMDGVAEGDTSAIEDYSGNLLLVIDDYETFTVIDRQQIERFIKRLNINHHKIVITTRANIVVGEEIKTNELDEERTRAFLEQVLQNEFLEVGLPVDFNDFTDTVIKEVHRITSGRPLFIIQFAYILAQEGLSRALSYNLKSERSAVEFLFGRIYEYLSDTAKNIFVVMGQLVLAAGSGELSNLVDKVKYILSMDERLDEFHSGLMELVKLRIIELTNGDKFYQIYSNEILEIMISRYEGRGDEFKTEIQSRLAEIGNDSKLDIEQALLSNANAARLSKDEDTVVDTYKKIVLRPQSPFSSKLSAHVCPFRTGKPVIA